MKSKSLTETSNKAITLPIRKVSIVNKLKKYLAKEDPKRQGTLADRLVEKYYSMAMHEDPIIMRDLINRIDGLPKQTLVNEGTQSNVNILLSLFGGSIRPLKDTNTEYQHIDTSEEE